MKTAAQIASHPKARLHREIVTNLRAFGSIEGAERAWLRFQLNPRLWKRIVTYGLGLPAGSAGKKKTPPPPPHPDGGEGAPKGEKTQKVIKTCAWGRPAQKGPPPV